MSNELPDISVLMSSLPEGTIPLKYAPFLQLLQSVLKDDDGEKKDPAQQLKIERLRRRLQEKEQRLLRARRTIRAYRLQNRLLARAHGACECWGGNADCETCGGRGSAGWTEPDRHLLQDLVGPLSEAFSVRPEAEPRAPTAKPKTERDEEKVS